MEALQHLPVSSLSQRLSEDCENATTLQNTEDSSDEVNKFTANDIQTEESCGSKQTEPDNEQKTESVKGEGRNEEQNKTNSTGSEEEEAEEKELVQNDEESQISEIFFD